MRIAGNSVSGQGPVNQWSAQITNGKIDGMISTRRAGTPSLMQLETQVLSSINGSTIKKADGKSDIKLTKGLKTVAVLQLIHAEAPR